MIQTNIKNSFIGSLSQVIFIISCVMFSLFSFSITNAELYGSDGFTAIFEGGEGIGGGADKLEEEIVGSNTGIAEGGSLMDTIIFIIKYLLIFAGIIALIAFLYAGFRYIVSFGGDVDIAKQAMINAAIGIIIILFSWMIIQFLISFDL